MRKATKSVREFPFLVWITLDDGLAAARGYCTRLGAIRAYNALRKGRFVTGLPLVLNWREIGWRENRGALSDHIIAGRGSSVSLAERGLI